MTDATDAIDGSMNSLEEQLRVYDDSFPRDNPSWDEDSIVTPRAFLSEYGYDVPGDEIPGDLASFLIGFPSTEEIVTVFRTFDDVEKYRDRETEHFVARMIDSGGLNSVEVFKVDNPLMEDGGILEGYATGGYLVRYSYIRSDSELDRTGHQRYGTYWMDINGVSQLLQKLLNGDDEGPWNPDEEKSPLLVQDWEEMDNPASHENWVVARYSGTGLSRGVAELVRDKLLFEKSVTKNPLSRFEEIQQTAD